MEPTYKLGQLLEKKKELFAQYEQLTIQMLTCPIETLENLTIQRQKLCDRIDNLDREIDHQTKEIPNGKTVIQALQLKCLRSQVSDQYLDFFDRAQEIFAIAHRVRQMDPEIATRVESELVALTDKIKENNRSVTAQAAKFGSGITSGQSTEILGSKYQKV